MPADCSCNFGAVDWHSKVSVNGKPVGEHKGGFDPFTLDITTHSSRRVTTIVVGVWDPTEKGSQPRGQATLESERHLVHAGQRHLADGVAGARAVLGC